MPLYSIIPFIAMLGVIAVFPGAFPHFWHRNRNKLAVSIIISIPAIIFILINNSGKQLYHTILFDYVPFIVLLGSLFVISGGIFLDCDFEARPQVNTTFLAIGAVLASIIGTTGAAMLLIRPLLHTNKRRNFRVHTILFFIAITANCGGLLSPLGNPPLFMMYLRGVNFFWFLNLFPEWFTTNFLLIIIYFFTDNYYWKRETAEARKREHDFVKPLTLQGKLNFIWLAGVILSVAFINNQWIPYFENNEYLSLIREAMILTMAFLSFKTTAHITRVSNSFSWEPIKEVSYLFLGIFITLVPCLIYMENNAKTLGITSTTQFYYYTGALSSLLDSTPTAVAFHSLARGLAEQTSIFSGNTMLAGIPLKIMRAICVSSVLFGAMTYIGNGPNFLIKSISESHNIKMPHFFAYMFKFSLIVLLPIFILIELVFG